MCDKKYGFIYSITNIVNKKVYIGQTTRKERKREHFYDLKINKHRNIYLQNSFNKYGESNFKFKIECYANSKNELDKLEIEYIKFNGYPNRDKCYNLREGGKTNIPSKEICKKISESKKGHPVSLETRKKLSESHKGKKCSKKNIERKREIMLNYYKNHNGYWQNKHLPPEVCKKISDSLKGNSYRLGIPHSLETRKKMSDSRKGKNNYPAKYTLWDLNKVHYFKGNMIKENRDFNPCKCFGLKYDTKNINIGLFIDFISPCIIYDLILNVF